ncbi:sugar kinase [Streptomyces sp. NPDC004838]
MTGTASADVADAAEVICLGESMVTFVPSRPGRLADVPSFARAIGGAESNVACALAAAGHRAKWVSRVGADGFGDHLIRAISAYGVDTSAVGRDPRRPTGIYFRTAADRSTDEHEVVYYRAGSAASAMSPDTVATADVTGARILHLSGITAALSADCLALMRRLTRPRAGRPLVSFDVNHRPRLWPEPAAANVLLELARGADLVFVGEDEAEAAWGVRGAAAIREAIPEPEAVVVKHGGRGATVFARGRGGSLAHEAEDGAGYESGDAAGYESGRIGGPRASGGSAGAGRGSSPGGANGHGRAGNAGSAGGGGGAGSGGAEYADGVVHAGGAGNAEGVGGAYSDRGVTGHPEPGGDGGDVVVFVSAPRVEVVAPIGAGDAFAAGYLSATLRGLPLRDRLRHGHLMAAATLTVREDLGTPPATAHADRLAALDDAAWGTLRLGPGWTSAVDEEVRTS